MGLDINHQDGEGNTALHVACINNNIDCIKLLLQNNANTTIRNMFDRFATQYLQDIPVCNIINDLAIDYLRKL